MYRYPIAITVILLTGTACVLAGQQASDMGVPERVRPLLEKLGSEKFAEREKAMKELEAIGPAALPELRPALKSDDAEVRRRAEALVRKFEEQDLAASLLTGKRVRVQLKAGSVDQALADLTRQSGYQVQVENPVGERKGTLDTGNTTFWQALDVLCTRAGLVEIHGIAAPVPQQIPLARIVDGTVSLGASVLHLFNGKPSKAPTCYAGSVRIRVMQATLAKSGEIDLVLQVTGEPRLLDLAAAGPPRVVKARDDQGQTLTSLPGVDPPPTVLPEINNGAGKGVAGKGQGNGIGNGNVGNGIFAVGATPAPTPGFKPFQVAVRFQAGDKSAKKLTELTGKLSLQTLIDADPVLAIDDILMAAGKSVKGVDGSSLGVPKVEQLANGDIRMDVSMDNLPGQNPLGALAGRIRIQGGAANIKVNGRQLVIGGLVEALGGGVPVRLMDAKGQSFAVAGVPSSSVSINNNQMSQTMTLVFRPREGQGPATRLIVPSYRTFTFEVPFTLHDIELQ